jgi:Uma2 family endonuclease
MALVEESDLELINAGRTTLQNVAEEQALEADQSFYIANANVVIGVSDLDRSIHPPPDLIIEFDPLLSSVPREAIYGRMGVPELWRYDGNEFEFLLLQPSGEFQTGERSLALPQLRPQDIKRLLEATHGMDDVAFVNHCRSWARTLSSRTPE